MHSISYIFVTNCSLYVLLYTYIDYIVIRNEMRKQIEMFHPVIIFDILNTGT